MTRSIAEAVLRCVAVLGCALGVLSAPAAGQPVSPADLRREIERQQEENQRLATLVRELEERLAAEAARADAAEARARTLEIEVGRLRAALEAGGVDAPAESTESEEVDGTTGEATARQAAAIPEDPLASPASMLVALQRRYAESFPSAEGSTGPAPLDVAQRRALAHWCSARASEFRGPVTWRVRLTRVEELPRGEHSVVLAVLEATSDLPIGSPLRVAMPRGFSDRVEREIARSGGDAKAPIWILIGSIAASPKVNPDRPVPGVFNHPEFVGAYVEFGFELKWEELTVAPPFTADPGDPAAGS